MVKRYKVIVYVPVAEAEKMREVIGAAVGGKMGKYSHCSFSIRGIGRFQPEAGADPHIGVVGKKEEVEEERIEIVCDEDVLNAVLQAIKKNHPYEEPATEIYLLHDALHD